MGTQLRTPLCRLTALLFLLLASAGIALAQTTTFTYQGRLTDDGALANGPYDIEFKLFDNADVQQGPTVTQEDVALVDGSFVVVLDFGDVFDGTERFLEIGVRPGASEDDFTILNPRWPITSTPYAIRSLKAGASDTATTAVTADTATTATDAAQLGGVAADQYVKTDDPRLTDGGPPAPGSPNYIQNGTTQQTGASFNIDGNGTLAGTLLARGATLQNSGNVARILLSTGSGVAGPATFRLQTDSGLAGQGKSFVIYSDDAAQYRMVINGAGNVGLGTPTPSGRLHVHHTGNVAPIFLSTGSGSQGPATFRLQADSGLVGQGKAFVIYSDDAAQYRMVINGAGNVGLGTPTPQTKLHVEGAGFVESTVRSTNGTAILNLDSSAGGQRRMWTLESGWGGQPGLFAIYDRTAQRLRLTIDPTGLTGVNALQITGGSDFSENFDVGAAKADSAASIKAEAGMLVTIDPASPGKLQLSKKAYDRRVAGVISGAGGVRTGMLMGQEGSLADGKHPVALSGRVYCWSDASQGAIRPGDLLTTSATPGHAMKVRSHAKAQGAIIGKAMTGLKRGKGLVLVLVSLQ